jgi:hypothetical protein
MRSRKHRIELLAGVGICAFTLGALVWAALAGAPQQDAALSSTFTDWLKHPAILYPDRSRTDPVAELIRKIDAGEVTLQHDGPSGYLRSLLAALDVPVTSHNFCRGVSQARPTRWERPVAPRSTSRRTVDAVSVQLYDLFCAVR